jgi:hypothetical protein
MQKGKRLMLEMKQGFKPFESIRAKVNGYHRIVRRNVTSGAVHWNYNQHYIPDHLVGENFLANNAEHQKIIDKFAPVNSCLPVTMSFADKRKMWSRQAARRKHNQ